MDPLCLFGMGTALAGFGGLGTTWRACREVLSIPRMHSTIGGSGLLCAMGFMMLVNIGIVVAGLWVAFAVAGGVHG
jgi:hypothetical protein